jgi:hypothetical protein
LAADDEELAEGLAGLYLRLWAPSFVRLEIVPLAGVDRFGDGGAHYLDLDNECITLISLEEAQQDRRDAKIGFSGGAVAARLLQRINRALEIAGKADRFYSVYGGNDGHVLILTPSMLAAITATRGIRRDELPYIRTANWPHFGMDVSTAET